MRHVGRWVLLVFMVVQIGHAAALEDTEALRHVSQPKVRIAPMSGPAIQGTACLGFAAAAIIAAYAAGPMETLMLISGAEHVATGPVTLFIPMMSILGGGACALAATSMPSISWMIDQSDNISSHIESLPNQLWNGNSANVHTNQSPPPIRQMTETEVQSAGCVVGSLASFTASMLSSPMEVAMLASGATTIVSSTSLLGLGLLATTVGAGCGIGSLSAVPIVAFFSNYSAIGENFFAAVNRQFGY